MSKASTDRSTATESDEELPLDYRILYWATTSAVVKDVFGGDEQLVADYQSRLAEASPRERLIAYHATPLQVAADLTLNDIVTTEHVEAYKITAAEFLSL